jgi:hypothetical protein
MTPAQKEEEFMEILFENPFTHEIGLTREEVYRIARECTELLEECNDEIS